MSGEAIWSFPINWATGVTEMYEWNTTALISPTGVEQRFANRFSPRRYLEYEFLLTGAERRAFDLLMMTHGAGDWFIPLATDGVFVPGPLAVGEIGLGADMNYLEFQVGGKVLVIGPGGPGDAEVLTVAQFYGFYMELGGSGLTRAYPNGAKLFPCFRARIVEMPQSVSRRSDDAYTGSIRFLCLETFDFQGVQEGYHTFLENKVLVLRHQPNAVRDMDYSYARMLREIDNGMALPHRVDSAGRAFASQSYSFFLVGRYERSGFRGFLKAMRGRAGQAWVPTFNADMKLVPGPAHAPNTLTVADNGLVELHPVAGRDHVMITLRDGGAYIRKITDLTRLNDKVIRLLLDEPIYAEVTSDTIRMVSFASLKRLDQDMVEVSHRADSKGVAECNIVFRDAGPTRDAPPFRFGYKAGNEQYGRNQQRYDRKFDYVTFPQAFRGRPRDVEGDVSRQPELLPPALIRPKTLLFSAWLSCDNQVDKSGFPQNALLSINFEHSNGAFSSRDRVESSVSVVAGSISPGLLYANVFQVGRLADGLPDGGPVSARRYFYYSAQVEGPIESGRPFHVMLAFELSTERVRFYLDDVSLTPYGIQSILNLNSNQNEGYYQPSTSVFSGCRISMQGRSCVKRLFFATPEEYFDLDVESNRRKFRTSDGKAVFLGDTGERPFGTPPHIHMDYKRGDPVETFLNNRGTLLPFIIGDGSSGREEYFRVKGCDQ